MNSWNLKVSNYIYKSVFNVVKFVLLCYKKTGETNERKRRHSENKETAKAEENNKM